VKRIGLVAAWISGLHVTPSPLDGVVGFVSFAQMHSRAREQARCRELKQVKADRQGCQKELDGPHGKSLRVSMATERLY
jgi:hypothetical protein